MYSSLSLRHSESALLATVLPKDKPGWERPEQPEGKEGWTEGGREACVYCWFSCWPISKQEKGCSVEPKRSLKPLSSPIQDGLGDFLHLVSQVAEGDNV